MSALAATVRDNASARRYELVLDDELVGELVYRTSRDTVHLMHTEIRPRLQGRGFGEQFVSGVLDDIRVRGLHIVPLCPYVAAFLRLHPEYGDLVDVRVRK